MSASRALSLAVVLCACGPLVPPSDAGTNMDAAVQDTSTTCIGDYGACVTGQSCCTPTFVCGASTHVCQAQCLSIGSLCSGDGDCCSGLCNGTCQ